MRYRLLDTFRATFEGKRYIHRDSSLGDFVAMQLYEDLYSVGKSAVLRKRIALAAANQGAAPTERFPPAPGPFQTA